MGTRFLPATRVIPKEMLPIAGRPMIEFAVQEAMASGIESVVLVLRAGKEIIAQHFGVEVARATGGSTADIVAPNGRLEIRIAWQEEPLGLADAIRMARPLIGNQPFAVILPDAIIQSKVPCTLQLLEAYAGHQGCVVATQRILDEDVDRFGVLEVSDVSRDRSGAMRVNALVERPKRGSVFSRYGIFGRYILEPEIFDCIDGTLPGLNGELQLTDALSIFLQSGSVYAYEFQGTHFDAGSKLGFVEANIAFALTDPEIGAELQHRMVGREWVPAARLA